MLKNRALLFTIMVFLAGGARASCEYSGFDFPEQWKIQLDGHVHVRNANPNPHMILSGIEPYEPPPAREGDIVFRSHAEVEAFVKETVEEGLRRVAQVSPCLLNNRIQRFGAEPVILTSEIDGDRVGYQFKKNGNFLGRGKKKAKIFLGASHPSANIADLKHKILHGVFHHLQLSNHSFATHKEHDAFMRDNFVFQDFKSFVEILKTDTTHACLQIAYPNMMFEELQGAEFMDACMTCINSYHHDGFLLNEVTIGPEAPEHRQKCENLRPEYLSRNNFQPTEESAQLMNTSEREELRQRSRERHEQFKRRFEERRAREAGQAISN